MQTFRGWLAAVDLDSWPSVLSVLLFIAVIVLVVVLILYFNIDVGRCNSNGDCWPEF